jgi:hypothetical protein
VYATRWGDSDPLPQERDYHRVRTLGSFDSLSRPACEVGVSHLAMSSDLLGPSCWSVPQLFLFSMEVLAEYRAGIGFIIVETPYRGKLLE